MTTNQDFAEWITVRAGDEKPTKALLDRLAITRDGDHHQRARAIACATPRPRRGRGADVSAASRRGYPAKPTQGGRSVLVVRQTRPPQGAMLSGFRWSESHRAGQRKVVAQTWRCLRLGS